MVKKTKQKKGAQAMGEKNPVNPWGEFVEALYSYVDSKLNGFGEMKNLLFTNIFLTENFINSSAYADYQKAVNAEQEFLSEIFRAIQTIKKFSSENLRNNLNVWREQLSGLYLKFSETTNKVMPTIKKTTTRIGQDENDLFEAMHSDAEERLKNLENIYHLLQFFISESEKESPDYNNLSKKLEDIKQNKEKEKPRLENIDALLKKLASAKKALEIEEKKKIQENNQEFCNILKDYCTKKLEDIGGVSDTSASSDASDQDLLLQKKYFTKLLEFLEKFQSNDVEENKKAMKDFIMFGTSILLPDQPNDENLFKKNETINSIDLSIKVWSEEQLPTGKPLESISKLKEAIQYKAPSPVSRPKTDADLPSSLGNSFADLKDEKAKDWSVLARHELCVKQFGSLDKATQGALDQCLQDASFLRKIEIKNESLEKQYDSWNNDLETAKKSLPGNPVSRFFANRNIGRLESKINQLNKRLYEAEETQSMLRPSEEKHARIVEHLLSPFKGEATDAMRSYAERYAKKILPKNFKLEYAQWIMNNLATAQIVNDYAKKLTVHEREEKVLKDMGKEATDRKTLRLARQSQSLEPKIYALDPQKDLLEGVQDAEENLKKLNKLKNRGLSALPKFLSDRFNQYHAVEEELYLNAHAAEWMDAKSLQELYRKASDHAHNQALDALIQEQTILEKVRQSREKRAKNAKYDRPMDTKEGWLWNTETSLHTVEKQALKQLRALREVREDRAKIPGATHGYSRKEKNEKAKKTLEMIECLRDPAFFQALPEGQRNIAQTLYSDVENAYGDLYKNSRLSLEAIEFLSKQTLPKLITLKDIAAFLHYRVHYPSKGGNRSWQSESKLLTELPKENLSHQEALQGLLSLEEKRAAVTEHLLGTLKKAQRTNAMKSYAERYAQKILPDDVTVQKAESIVANLESADEVQHNLESADEVQHYAKKLAVHAREQHALGKKKNRAEDRDSLRKTRQSQLLGKKIYKLGPQKDLLEGVHKAQKDLDLLKEMKKTNVTKLGKQLSGFIQGRFMRYQAAEARYYLQRHKDDFMTTEERESLREEAKNHGFTQALDALIKEQTILKQVHDLRKERAESQENKPMHSKKGWLWGETKTSTSVHTLERQALEELRTLREYHELSQRALENFSGYVEDETTQSNTKNALEFLALIRSNRTVFEALPASQQGSATKFFQEVKEKFGDLQPGSPLSLEAVEFLSKQTLPKLITLDEVGVFLAHRLAHPSKSNWKQECALLLDAGKLGEAIYERLVNAKDYQEALTIVNRLKTGLDQPRPAFSGLSAYADRLVALPELAEDKRMNEEKLDECAEKIANQASLSVQDVVEFLKLWPSQQIADIMDGQDEPAKKKLCGKFSRSLKEASLSQQEKIRSLAFNLREDNLFGQNKPAEEYYEIALEGELRETRNAITQYEGLLEDISEEIKKLQTTIQEKQLLEKINEQEKNSLTLINLRKQKEKLEEVLKGTNENGVNVSFYGEPSRGLKAKKDGAYQEAKNAIGRLPAYENLGHLGLGTSPFTSVDYRLIDTEQKRDAMLNYRLETDRRILAVHKKFGLPNDRREGKVVFKDQVHVQWLQGIGTIMEDLALKEFTLPPQAPGKLSLACSESFMNDWFAYLEQNPSLYRYREEALRLLHESAKLVSQDSSFNFNEAVQKVIDKGRPQEGFCEAYSTLVQNIDKANSREKLLELLKDDHDRLWILADAYYASLQQAVSASSTYVKDASTLLDRVDVLAGAKVRLLAAIDPDGVFRDTNAPESAKHFGWSRVDQIISKAVEKANTNPELASTQELLDQTPHPQTTAPDPTFFESLWDAVERVWINESLEGEKPLPNPKNTQQEPLNREKNREKNLR
jgi:hypothetical protein